MTTPAIPLSTGAKLPVVGLGLWKIPKPDAANLVQHAIRSGYRHLDAACDYGNEAEVGDGIRAALAAGQCKRDELWVTSKLWNTYHAKQHVRPALERTLRDLKLDHLDLYLVHFPIVQEYVPFDERYPPGWFHDPSAPKPHMKTAKVSLAETWEAMEDLVKAGLAKQIGVSNYGTSLLRDLLSYARIPPTVLQVELHPYLTQEKLLRFCRENDIAVTAFSPLGAPSYIPLGMAAENQNVLNFPVVRNIGMLHDKTPAQVVLRWGVQRGTAIVPKTANPARLVENLNIFDFQLTTDEMAAISALDRNRRFNDPGVFCEAAFNTYYPIYE